jgi:D-alanine-D-alanine ligase-like ATP-grasp enzyme
MPTFDIVEIEPTLTQETINAAQYLEECNRLERCYTAAEAGSGYSVTVRPARAGEASGCYIVRANGNLQILGYSLDIPEDLQDLREAAWELYCSDKF